MAHTFRLILALTLVASTRGNAQAALRLAPSGRGTAEVTLSSPRPAGTAAAAPATPAAKPLAIRLDYGQPHLRGRTLHTDSLLPYNKPWRLGANGVTTLATDVDLVLGGATIAKGTYVLYTIPGRTTWTLVVQRNVGQAAMVYVDTGAARVALDPGFDAVEKPLPSPEELQKNENLDGLTKEQLDTFRRRAVPEPGAALREGPDLMNDARLAIPSTVICTGYTSEEYRDAVAKGYEFVSGLADLRDVTYVDLPTSHWPMWSRPGELAKIIGDIAKARAARG